MEQTWTQTPVSQNYFRPSGTNITPTIRPPVSPTPVTPVRPGSDSAANGSQIDPFMIQQAVIPQYSRTERYQEKQKMWQAKFHPRDYQVTRKTNLPSRDDPTLTIREKTIAFNNACIRVLDAITHIQLLINSMEKVVAIRGCDEWAKDAIRWCILREDERRTSRQISCDRFTSKIYKLMDWESHIRYRMLGYKIDYEGDPVFIFELQEGEGFLKRFRDPQSGKLIKPPSIQPESWNNSFGLNAEEHANSVKYDLMADFESVAVDEM